MALIEEMNQNAKKKRRSAAERDLEDDNEESHNEDGSSSDSNDDNGPYAWIGRWVQKPKGERCRKSKDGREAFTTEGLLKQARITNMQYGMYKVCHQFTFGRTTDSPQKTAHQLIGRYFDTTKTYMTNIQNHPDSWRLIIEKVYSVSFLFDVSTFPADERTSPTLPMACKELGH